MAAVEISASRFKAECLALLDEVAATGTELIVTKRGRPVARVVPLADGDAVSLHGSVRYATEEDLLAPVPEHWEAEND
jgi:prevent-host-death family protein